TISGIGVRKCTHTFIPGEYDVTLAINREGSPTRSIKTNPLKISKLVTTGIASIVHSPDNMLLYPNPNNGSFKISVKGIEGNQDAQLQITNLLGEVIYQTSTHAYNGMVQQDISLPNVSAGTYFVRILTASKVYNSKVVIAK
ncbi:MAG TPA: T9SS type A sorting domain-containing protein, partial [Bacteroidia bacterium]|nr:T9SS type A sorting domain-containing protein [Bacteroidia bacterium]